MLAASCSVEFLHLLFSAPLQSERNIVMRRPAGRKLAAIDLWAKELQCNLLAIADDLICSAAEARQKPEEKT